MIKININLTTTMFVGDNLLSVLGVFDSHSNVLAYNKPLVTGDELRGMMVIAQSISDKPKEIERFQTDSFSVQVYNHRTGGTSDLWETVSEGKPVNSSLLHNGPTEN